jgi:hypothetical protein
MDSGKCEWCGTKFPLTRPDRRYCCDQHQRNASNARARKRKQVDLICDNCGNTYRAYPYPRSKERKRYYCSPGCQYEARRWRLIQVTSVPIPWRDCANCGKRFISRNGHHYCANCYVPGPTTPLTDEEAMIAYDPCAFCGQRPAKNGSGAKGIDHIHPTSKGGGDEWANWTACCHRCNGQKGELPLLGYLLWRQLQPVRLQMERVNALRR